ncbi:MAG: hypothetical protein AAB499_00940 [Patescibacteria group bacterium]
MRSLQDEIRQVQRDLACPICSRRFELKDIQIVTDSDYGRAQVSVNCRRGHFPVVLGVPVVLPTLSSAGPISARELRTSAILIDRLGSMDDLLPPTKK